MRYVAAYLLAALGGNDNPEAKDIKKILESVGIEADDTRLNKVQRLPLSIFLLVTGTLVLSAAGHIFRYSCCCFFFPRQVISELKGKNVEEVIATGTFLTIFLFKLCCV